MGVFQVPFGFSGMYLHNGKAPRATVKPVYAGSKLKTIVWKLHHLFSRCCCSKMEKSTKLSSYARNAAMHECCFILLVLFSIICNLHSTPTEDEEDDPMSKSHVWHILFNWLEINATTTTSSLAPPELSAEKVGADFPSGRPLKGIKMPLRCYTDTKIQPIVRCDFWARHDLRFLLL